MTNLLEFDCMPCEYMKKIKTNETEYANELVGSVNEATIILVPSLLMRYQHQMRMEGW